MNKLTLDLHRSKIIFRFTFNGNEFEYFVPSISGMLSFDQGVLQTGHISFSMADIVSETRAVHYSDVNLFDQNALNLNVFPESLFLLTEALLAKRELMYDTYFITGNLTIKNIEQSVNFPVRVFKADTAIELTSEFSINPGQWNIKLPDEAGSKNVAISTKLYFRALN